MTSTSAFFAVRRREEVRRRLKAAHRDAITDRNFYAATSAWISAAALVTAGVGDIHLALGLVVIASILARLAVAMQRRADALLPRAVSADLAEGTDPIQMQEAA
jgi:hypothetical protein